MNVEHEVQLLKEEIKRLGAANAAGNITVTFGVLFHDDRCANIFEGKVASFLNLMNLNCELALPANLIIFVSE